MTSGEGTKGQAFKATAEAAGHTLRVPVQHEGKPLSVEMALTDLVGGRVCWVSWTMGGLGGSIDTTIEEEREDDDNGSLGSTAPSRPPSSTHTNKLTTTAN